MPKVTLLKDTDKCYFLHFGKGMYEFYGGVSQEVPVAVALELKRRAEAGKSIFRVSGLPKVVENTEMYEKQDKQTVRGGITQLRLI